MQYHAQAQARHVATFSLGSPVALTCSLDAFPTGQTSTGDPRFSVTAADVAALCKVPLKRVVGLSLMLSLNPDATEGVPHTVRVDGNPPPSVEGTGSDRPQTDADPFHPAQTQAQPASETFAFGPGVTGGVRGEFDASEALAAVLGYFGGNGLNRPGGITSASAGVSGRQGAAPGTGSGAQPVGLMHALIDVDFAGKVIAAEYYEAALNEHSSRTASNLVRMVPDALRQLAGSVQPETAERLAGLALHFADWLKEPRANR